MLDFESGAFENEFDIHYGLIAPKQTVLVRAYSDDSDDRMLAEIQPKFIVMFEPSMECIRRIEVRLKMRLNFLPNIYMKVYKSSNPGLAVRVYHMVYSNSCEEHKYLAGIRKEKESFERLIKERGVSTLHPLNPSMFNVRVSPCSYRCWRSVEMIPVTHSSRQSAPG